MTADLFIDSERDDRARGFWKFFAGAKTHRPADADICLGS
jgi:hypothetical protein